MLVKQIRSLDEIQKTCSAIPDLVAKAQENSNRSTQILQLLSVFPNCNAQIDRISKGVEGLERSAKGMRVCFSD